MDLGATDKVRPLIAAVRAMVRDEIMPLEDEYEAEVGREGDRFKPTKRMTEIRESLKARARAKGLWNFWLTASDKGYGLTTVEYAYLAEEMGWSFLAAEVFNCSAPDTGNMEVIERYGSSEQKARWLPDLLEGRARSAYLMTEPGVASSDATNIAMDARLEGDEWVLNGEKWWSSGAGDPRCSLYIAMTLSDPEAAAACAPLDAHGPGRDEGHRGSAGDEGLRRRRRAARAHAYPLSRRPRPEGCAGARPGAASRSRRGGSGRGASTIACARSARPSGRSRRCAGARPPAPRSGRSSRGSAPIPTSSPNCA